MKIVQEHPGISQRNIARMLELPHVITHRHIKKMAVMGVLVIHRAGIATKCYPAPEWKDRPPGSVSHVNDEADKKG